MRSRYRIDVDAPHYLNRLLLWYERNETTSYDFAIDIENEL
jgi:hypothetical protein